MVTARIHVKISQRFIHDTRYLIGLAVRICIGLLLLEQPKKCQKGAKGVILSWRQLFNGNSVDKHYQVVARPLSQFLSNWLIFPEHPTLKSTNHMKIGSSLLSQTTENKLFVPGRRFSDLVNFSSAFNRILNLQ